MKEYAYENGKSFSLGDLESHFIDKDSYARAHQGLPIACHDVIIEHNNGLLLIERNNVPVKKELWFIGGRIERGMPIVDSLRKKVRAECGLELSDIRELGTARTFFKTDPFGHGHGTDTINLIFFARGKGEIKLDTWHKNPVLVHPQDYTVQFRKKLHPYVRDFMDEGMKILETMRS
ncbi:NUDIX domain-containing protein [Candidatus Woesearchaeota archaeon]|nr:NUDIX domain-containing protein [Candidatus Woesearchaeota archaeon]